MMTRSPFRVGISSFMVREPTLLWTIQILLLKQPEHELPARKGWKSLFDLCLSFVLASSNSSCDTRGMAAETKH